MKHLVDWGITSDMAIDRVNSVYGVNAIFYDKKRDRLNPNLVM